MLHDPLPEEPWTDLGYAHRLAEFVQGGEFLHIPIWKEWRHWTGKRWEPDESGAIYEKAKLLARYMTDVAEAIQDEKVQKKYHQIALAHESAASVSAMVKLASTDPAFVARPKDFDANPKLFNTPSGVYDLTSDEVLPHAPHLMLSKMSIGSFDPAAYTQPAGGRYFKPFLTRLHPATDKRSYLGSVMGCMLEGRVTEQILVLFVGSGANGKSTFDLAVNHALGNYSTVSDGAALCDPSVHPTAIANLAGRRMVFVNELGNIDENRVKLLTSQDDLSARRMRENYWSFPPSHNIIAAMNTQPHLRGTNEGIWRRILIIPWSIQLPRSEWDADMGLKLETESDFIVTWLLKGYQRYRKHGLRPPSAVRSANVALRDELDPVSAWLRDQCRRGETFSARAGDLWTSFEKWQAKTGGRKLTQTAFGRSLGDKSFEKRRDSQGVIWNGLTLAHTVVSELEL